MLYELCYQIKLLNELQTLQTQFLSEHRHYEQKPLILSKMLEKLLNDSFLDYGEVLNELYLVTMLKK